MSSPENSALPRADRPVNAWLVSGRAAGGPWPGVLAAPGRVVVDIPTVLVWDPQPGPLGTAHQLPTDLEIVVLDGPDVVRLPVTAVVVVHDYTAAGRTVVLVEVPIDATVPAGAMLETCLRVLLSGGTVPEGGDGEALGARPDPPEILSRLPAPVDRGLPIELRDPLHGMTVRMNWGPCLLLWWLC